MAVPKIFQRRRLSRKTSVEHERLTSLVNSMADGVIAVDQHMRIVVSNGAALNILDVNSSLHGKLLGEVLHLRDQNNQLVDSETLVRAAKTATTSREFRLRYSDSSMINLYLSIAPVHLGYGQRNHGFVLLIRDITNEKSLEEERDEFISVVSHELRTPLAIAEGNISNARFIAEKTQDIDAIQNALDQAHKQTLFLAAMVNDLATLSRAERGKLDLQIAAIDVPNLMTELVDAYRPDAATKGLALEATVGQGTDVLQSSALYVREVLQNFITNAIKYTEAGHITIHAQAKEKGVLFTVTDTGIGISKPDQEKVYDKFFRSEDFRTRKTGGTGLGLYVTVKLARLLHAEIELKSRLNKGSAFSIFIPDLQ